MSTGPSTYDLSKENAAYKAKETAYNAALDQDNRRQAMLDQARAEREKDLKEGAAKGNELFGNGATGRVDENRSAEVSDLIARRQKEANGFTPEEQNAFRDTNLASSNQSLSGQLRALKASQGASGVRGNVAVAQRAKLMSDAQGQNVASERDLFLKNIDARRTGLNSLEQSTTGARADELARKTYNLDQLNKEKYGQLATALGYGSMGAGERAAIMQQLTGEAQAKATVEAAEKDNGGGLCCFIFMEARYGDGTLDHVVRKFRNEMLTDQNRRGYYKVSEVLVPLMRKSRVVKFAVRAFMTDPLVAYGRAYYGEGTKLGLVFQPVKNFWLRLFHYLGGEHPFIRENGEVI